MQRFVVAIAAAIVVTVSARVSSAAIQLPATKAELTALGREHRTAGDHQTYLINEMVNDIRRIYTDGRGHVPEADRYPLYNGDSIGFWDGQRLVIHTNQLTSGQYQRTQPEYTDQVETVEIWQKIDDSNIVAHVWVYDPPSLAEPWYVKQTYTKLSNDDRSLRIRYWDCGENQNNQVIQTDSGSSQFRDFTFTSSDDNKAEAGQ